MMSNRKYVVLGGGGSFGIHTSMYLLDHAEPAKVVGIGRNPLRNEVFSLGIERRARYEYRALHLTHELDLLLEYLDDLRPDVIINYAAQGEGAASWKHSWRFFETNSMALARLTEELMRRDYVDRFVQVSSSEVYGSVEFAAKEDAPINPSSPYAASKVAFDMYLLSMQRFKGLRMNIVRPSNCYCPGQLLHRVIPRTIWCALTGQKLPLHGGGFAEKSYLHARDLARAIYLILDGGEKTMGKVFNIGPTNPVTVREVVERTAEALGLRFDQLCEVSGERLGQEGRLWIDSTRAERELGWTQSIGWDEGLAEMVAWGRQYRSELIRMSPEYSLRA